MGVVCLLALGLLMAGCGADDVALRAAATPGTTTYSDERRGYEVTFPSDWQLAREVLTPALGDPREILSLGTVAPVRNGEHAACPQHAVATLGRVGAQDVFLTVQERTNRTSVEMLPGPPRLEDVRPDDSEIPQCLGGAMPFRTYWMPFRSGERGFYALAAVGDEAPAKLLQDLEAVLRSLTFRPTRVEDDRQRGVRFSYAAPWRIYPFALAEAVELRHQIALGTFDLDQAHPDPNCSPRSALEARGDGGLLYIFEYRDLNEQQLEGFPERPGRFELDPRDPQAYECFGKSYLIRWREFHGRSFQAHLYGSPRWIEQGLGILDSLEVAEQQE